MPTGIRHHFAERSRTNRIAIRFASRFNMTMAMLLATLMIGEILLARRVNLRGTALLFDAWPGFLLVIGCLIYCERRPLPNLIASAELTVWAVLSSNVLALMIQIAARSPYPLGDARLMMLDRAMHFNTAAIVHFVARFPPAREVFVLAYAAIPHLVFAAILMPPFFHRRIASQRYILSVVLATIFTSVLFALWPACGPWTTEPLQPDAEQTAITARLLLLKSAPVATLDFEHTAVVSFPSFHVILAILSAIALNGVPRARVFAIILAVLTCVSTVTTGWHYGIDIAGGVAVAVASWSLARLAVVSETSSLAASSLAPLVKTIDTIDDMA